MSYEVSVGKRYLVSRRSTRTISVITWISISGVALGVVALVVVTSVMNGFRDNLRKAIIGALPHVTVSGWEGGIYDHESLLDKARENPDVIAAAPYIYKQALIGSPEHSKGALIRGIDTDLEPFVTEIGSFVKTEIYEYPERTVEEQAAISKKIMDRLNFSKSREAGLKGGIVLGAQLAMSLDAQIGSIVQLISSEQRMTPIGDVPRVKKLEVVGIFESGISGYDEVLAFVDYRWVQRIYDMTGRVSGIGVRIEEAERAPEIAETLKKELDPYLVSNWADENKGIFQVMKLEKIGLFLILAVVVLVAAFNIISSLVMMVIEKSKEIAILKSIGATDGSIRQIFMYQGILVGTVGTVFGVSIGLFICWLLMTFNIIPIPPGVYPGGNRIPVSISWPEIGFTAFSSFMICLLVTIYPATIAAKVNPVEALRNE